MSKKQKNTVNLICSNRKARHDYHISETIEAGIALQGWELKSIRAGKAQLKESYIILKHSEAWLIGCHISPLSTVSTHVKADATRTRKLLLHRREIDKMTGAVAQKGFTVIACDMHWKKHLVKLTIALGKGKKLHDKRASAKEKEWNMSKQRILKTNNRA